MQRVIGSRLGQVLVIAALIVVATGTLAYSHGGDTNKVHGCKLKSATGSRPVGDLRLVNPTQNCNTTTETAVDWPKVSLPGYQIVKEQHSVGSTTNRQYVRDVICPSPKRVVGGGGFISGDAARLVWSYPRFNNTWEVFYEFDSAPNSGTITVYAICVA
jgi:hypothetical protein